MLSNILLHSVFSCPLFYPIYEMEMVELADVEIMPFSANNGEYNKILFPNYVKLPYYYCFLIQRATSDPFIF